MNKDFSRICIFYIVILFILMIILFFSCNNNVETIKVDNIDSLSDSTLNHKILISYDSLVKLNSKIQ